MWEKAEGFLREAIERRNLPYEINPGDGAFYGPKIDIKVKDALGRWWQCSTVQVDFNLPERFDITYRTAENTSERPWMLHRALFGSIERFLGILIEHTSGNLPLWLRSSRGDGPAGRGRVACAWRPHRGVRPERAHARQDRQGAGAACALHARHR